MKENGNWKEWGTNKDPYNDLSFSKESTDIKIIEEENLDDIN